MSTLYRGTSSLTESAPRVVRDAVFAEPQGYRPLSADIYLPATSHPPVIVFVHGGGWRQGSRRTFCPGLSAEASFGRLTARGWAVVSIDYRLSGEAVFPAQLQDVSAAIEWVQHDGVAEYGLDAERLALWGESAGGHLAALAALQPDSGVRAVVDWYGPSDLLTLPQPDDVALSREAGLLGGAVTALPDLARAASPVHAVHSVAPPFLLAHGLADQAVPSSQSVAFADALNAAGARVSLQLVDGADHLWRGLANVDVVFDPALEFLDRHVLGL